MIYLLLSFRERAAFAAPEYLTLQGESQPLWSLPIPVRHCKSVCHPWSPKFRGGRAMLQCLLTGTETSSDLSLSLCAHEQLVEENLTLLWPSMQVQVRRWGGSMSQKTFTCMAFISGKLQFILLHASFIIILRRATGGRDQHQWFCLPKARVRCILKHWNSVLSLFSPLPWISKGLKLWASVSLASNWPNPPDVSW